MEYSGTGGTFDVLHNQAIILLFLACILYQVHVYVGM